MSGSLLQFDGKIFFHISRADPNDNKISRESLTKEGKRLFNQGFCNSI